MPLDFGLGLLLGLLISQANGIHSGWIPLATALFAVLPDVDFLVWRAKSSEDGRFAYEHRQLLHRPIPYLSLGIATCVIFKPQLLMPFFVGSLAHFVHDTFGMGWGVQWLYPLTDSWFMALKRLPDGSRRVLRALSPSAVRAYARDSRNRHWMRDTYLRPSMTALIEYLVLVSGVLAVALASG